VSKEKAFRVLCKETKAIGSFGRMPVSAHFKGPSLGPKSFRSRIMLPVVFIALCHILAPVPASAQATTLNFTSVGITPANSTVGLGRQTMLSATAAFNDGSSQSYTSGQWDILFSPQMDVSLCPPLPIGAPVFAQQPVQEASNGSFHRTWEPPQNNVTADGSMTAASFSATLTCTLGGAALGSISANWAGMEFDGTFTAARNSGNVIIRGITWNSSNPGVATIDVTGAVTGVSPGVTTITATYGAACKKVGGQPPVPVWGCQGATSGSTTLTVGTSSTHSDDNNDSGSIKSGYVIITPVSGAPAGGILAFATFGLKRSDGDTAQAGVLPAAMTTNAVVGVATNSQLGRDLGLALVNPGAATANVTLTLRKADGSLVGTKSEVLAAGNQGALFVTQIFSDQSSVLSNFLGTLSITSDNPIAMVGLQFRAVEFSTILITSLSATPSVPTISQGVGGTGALILPHFAENGGWSTQFVIANPGTTTLIARLDIFDSSGKPLQITLNGVTQSTFNVTVNPNGVAILAPVDAATGQSRF